MKKILLKIGCALLCVCSLGLVSCKKDKAEKTANLYESGIETALVIDVMARNEIYKASIGLDYDVTSVLAEDYRNPTNVYSISIPTIEEFFQVVEAGGLEEEWDLLPDSVKEQMESRADPFNFIISHYAGHNEVAVSTSYQASLRFDGKIDEKIAYVYVYETGTPIVVTFTPICDHGYSAMGSFLFGVDCTSMEKIEEVFKPFQCEVALVTA